MAGARNEYGIPGIRIAHLSDLGYGIDVVVIFAVEVNEPDIVDVIWVGRTPS
jgi:hypothetical protein